MPAPEPLRQHYLFASLDERQFARVAAAAHPLELPENGHLFHFGDPARYFYWLEAGQIQLYRLSPGGEEKVIEIIQPGQTFAEAVMFLQMPVYPVSAKAVFASRLWRIDMAVFLALLQESNPLCLNLLGGMSRRLHGAISDIDQLTLQNASMRVIQLLLQSAPDTTENPYSLEWETPKQVLASRYQYARRHFRGFCSNLAAKA